MMVTTARPALRHNAGTDAAALIRIGDVSKTYVSASGAAVHALNRVSLDIRQGEFVCVVGPSGCGKSTLLRLLAGLDTHSEGELLLGGEPVVGPSRKVGVVFQAANLLPWMSVRENVRLPLRVGGVHAPADDRIDRLLGQVPDDELDCHDGTI